MDQKTIITLEFAWGEEAIASAVMAVVAAGRDGVAMSPALAKLETVMRGDAIADGAESESEKPKRKAASRKKKESAVESDDAETTRRRGAADPDEDVEEAPRRRRTADDDDEPRRRRAADPDEEKPNKKRGALTHDDVRDLMAEVIESDETLKGKIAKELKAFNARSVGTLAEDDLPEFFDFLKGLKA